jgi:hypothetical protein
VLVFKNQTTMKKHSPHKNAIYIDSEALKMVNYSEDKHILEAQFLNGGKYRYKSVPATIWQEFVTVINAGLSVGAYFNKKIKPYYECEEITA